MVAYDERVIQRHADGLYARGRRAAVVYGLASAAMGVGVGYTFSYAVTSGAAERESLRLVLAALLGVFGLVLGLVAGSERASVLKLHAQQALCQLQIEVNTRAKGDAAGAEERASRPPAA